MSQSISLKEKFFKPVSGQSLAVFRICFGFILTWDMVLDLFYKEADLLYQYVRPTFYLKHSWFQWVQAWPEFWVAQLHLTILLICSIFIMVGYYTRISLIVATLLFAYMFFIDMTYYLNHYYLMILLGILLAALPCNRKWSLDALRHPEWGQGDVPKWTVWSVRFFMEILLVFAGLVKINPDWLRLEPLGEWLRVRSQWHFFHDLAYFDWFIWLGAYGAIAIHLLGAPLLLWKKTRLGTFFVYCGFHFLNSYTFDIGVFPFLTIFATLIFFSADWPTQFWQWLIAKRDFIKTRYADRVARPNQDGQFAKWAFGFVVVFLVWQILMPLRAAVYPGNSLWTREGEQFAWHMKLSDHQIGKTVWKIYSPSANKTWFIDNFDSYMDRRKAVVMLSHPQYVMQFAHYLQSKWAADGYDDVQIYAEIWLSLNYRPFQLFIDPEVDLTKVKWDWHHVDWVVPLQDGKPVPWRERRRLKELGEWPPIEASSQ